MGYGWKWEKWNKGKEEGRNIIISKDVGVDNFRWCSYCRTLLFFLFFSLRYEMRKEKNFHFFCIISSIHYLLLEIWLREKQVRYRERLLFATCMAQ